MVNSRWQAGDVFQGANGMYSLSANILILKSCIFVRDDQMLQRSSLYTGGMTSCAEKERYSMFRWW